MLNSAGHSQWATGNMGPRPNPALQATAKSGPRLSAQVVGPTKLQHLQKTVVLGMTSYPEPCHSVVLPKSDRPVSEGYANGVHRVLFVDPLEMEAGVLGVLAKESVGFLSSVPNFRRQLMIRRPEARRGARLHSLSGSRTVVRPAARSARASAASLLRAFGEARNWLAQCSSSRSSSRSQRATRSCSSGGRVANLAITASSAPVMNPVYRTMSGLPNEGMHPTAARAAAAAERQVVRPLQGDEAGRLDGGADSGAMRFYFVPCRQL